MHRRNSQQTRSKRQESVKKRLACASATSQRQHKGERSRPEVIDDAPEPHNIRLDSRVQDLGFHAGHFRVLPRHALGVQAAVLSRRTAVLSELNPQHAPVLGGGGVAKALHFTGPAVARACMLQRGCRNTTDGTTNSLHVGWVPQTRGGRLDLVRVGTPDGCVSSGPTWPVHGLTNTTGYVRYEDTIAEERDKPKRYKAPTPPKTVLTPRTYSLKRPHSKHATTHSNEMAQHNYCSCRSPPSPWRKRTGAARLYSVRYRSVRGTVTVQILAFAVELRSMSRTSGLSMYVPAG